MPGKKYVLPLLIACSLISVILAGCGGGNGSVNFSQLISQAAKYNGQTVTLEAFYFSGFEIAAISGSLEPSTFGAGRIQPAGSLVWVKGGLSQDVYNQLQIQTDTPSGYAEHFGKLRVTGKFETGGKYGHLDAYQYQITITSAELLEWTPPPASPASTGNLQIKVVDLYDRPLGGAKVVSEEEPGGQLKVTGLTDGNGLVIFKGIRSGDYQFYVSRYDYAQKIFSVSVTAVQNTEETVHLDSDG
jgi:hypothetical protein